MLLGSLSDDLDKKTTPGTPVASPPPSSGSFQSPSRRAEPRRSSQHSTNYLIGGSAPNHEIYDLQVMQQEETEMNSYLDKEPDLQETSLSHNRQASETSNPRSPNSPKSTVESEDHRQAETSLPFSPRQTLEDDSAQDRMVAAREESGSITQGDSNQRVI